MEPREPKKISALEFLEKLDIAPTNEGTVNLILAAITQILSNENLAPNTPLTEALVNEILTTLKQQANDEQIDNMTVSSLRNKVKNALKQGSSAISESEETNNTPDLEEKLSKVLEKYHDQPGEMWFSIKSLVKLGIIQRGKSRQLVRKFGNIDDIRILHGLKPTVLLVPGLLGNDKATEIIEIANYLAEQTVYSRTENSIISLLHEKLERESLNNSEDLMRLAVHLASEHKVFFSIDLVNMNNDEISQLSQKLEQTFNRRDFKETIESNLFSLVELLK